MRDNPPAAAEIRQRGRPDFVDRTIAWILVGFVLFQLAFAIVWIRRDTTPPYWDEAWYAYQGAVQYDALRNGGLASWADAWLNLDRTRPTLVPTLTIPFYALFGTSGDAGLVLNLVAWAVLLTVTYALGTSIGGRRAGLLSSLLIGSYPVLIGLVHILLVELVMVTLVAGTLFALWRSEGLEHRRWAVAAGILSGLGALTKVFFVVFVIGPWLVAIMRSLLQQEARRRWHGLTNLGLGTGAAALVAVWWYVPNFRIVIDRTLSAGLGPEGAAYGPGNPLHWSNLVTYLVEFAGKGTAFAGFLALMAGAVGLILTDRRQRQHGGAQEPLDKHAVLLLCSSVVVGYALFTCLHNQDLKHVTGILPGLAVLSGWGIARLVRRRWVIVAALVLLLAVFQTVASTTPGPLRRWKLQVPVLHGQLWFFYPAQPGVLSTRYATPDDSTWPLHEVLSYALLVADLESLNRSEAHVAVVPDYPGFEVYALLFEVTRRGMPMTVELATLASLPAQDVIIHKTGDWGWDASEPAIEAVTQAISDPTSGFQRMPRTFSLPDGSEALVYGRRPSPLLDHAPSPSHPSSVEFGGAARYLGFDVELLASPSGGVTLGFTHYWESLQATQGDYAAFVHLLDPKTDAIVAQDDHALFPHTYPTGIWQAGRFVYEKREVQVPASYAGSEVKLRLGLYNDDGRLAVSSTDDGAARGATFADVGLVPASLPPSGSDAE